MKRPEQKLPVSNDVQSVYNEISISKNYRSVMMYRVSTMKRPEQKLPVSNDVQSVYNETS
jgi:hypothetical protein